MKKKRGKVIDVASKLLSVLASRDITRTLRKLILASHGAEVFLDFKGVEFVSRSAAHELLLLKEELSKSISHAAEVLFVNANPHITAMFQAVASSRIAPKKRPVSLRIERIGIQSLRSLASF